MKKRTMAFYDLLLYSIVCVPLIVIAVVLLFVMVTRGRLEWNLESWCLVVAFAVSSVLPLAGIMLLRYYEIRNDSIYFHYFPFTTSWEKASNNIDVRWNRDIFLTEIENVEIVRLTEEEKQAKIFYRHWFNKYLKITLKYGSTKYVYVGNYANYQIRKMMKLFVHEETP